MIGFWKLLTGCLAIRERDLLYGLSDAVVSTWIGISEPSGDLYEVPKEVLQKISVQFNFPVFAGDFDYFLGQGTPVEEDSARQP